MDLELRVVNLGILDTLNGISRIPPLHFKLKYLFLKDLAGNKPKNKRRILSNLLIYKYLTAKSLFLKDLAFLAR
jgi:hypothetical protein